MTTPLLTTKLYIPPVRPDPSASSGQVPSTGLRTRLVSRPRLIERLDAGLLHRRKLTLISAPAGFGKTTLLSEWARHRGGMTPPLPIAWVSLDKGDNDRTRFWAYVIAALQTVHADIGQAALAMLQSPQPPPAEVLLAGLINEIAAISDPPSAGLRRAQPSRSGHGFALVLDDFHVITAQPVNDALSFLLDHMPPQMHLVLSGRADPSWSLARLRARREMTELRADDLRFTATEAAAFLNDVMGLGLSAQDIAALDGRTEGWIVGLQLAALSMRGREDVTAFVKAFSGSHRFILDYLVEEVLDRQSSDVQEFLLKTSILERMSASLCNAVTGRCDSQASLTRLEQANLFLIPLDDERRWYRYHHLFADLLRNRLEQSPPSVPPAGGGDERGGVPALHRRASEWYEGAELIEEAVAHAFAGEDMERAASLAEQNAMQMIIHGKLTTLSWWLEALPYELVRARPWLLVYHAWARYWIGLREQGEECLRNAERMLEGTPLPSDGERRSTEVSVQTETEEQPIAGHVAAIRAYYALTNEEIPRALETAQRALELLPEGDYMHSMAALALGGAYWGRGDAVAAQQAFARASATAQKCGYRFLAVSAACYVGMQQEKQARLYEASETYRKALELAIGPGGRELPPAGYPFVKLGDLSREWHDLETASRNLVKGVELCVQWGQVDVLADGYIALARLQLAQGNLEEAVATLQKAEQLAQRTKVDPWVTCWLDDCRLQLWLSAGNLAAAVRWAQTSGLRADGELSYQHDLNHANLARVLVAQGLQQPSGAYLDEALGLLARLLEAAEAGEWVNEAIKILILQALALQARGDGEGALTTLARALTLAEPGGYVRTFIDEGAPMGKLLRQAAVRGVAVDYVGKLLAALDQARSRLVGAQASDLQPATPEPETELAEPLSERELQVLRLLGAGLSSTEVAAELYIAVSTARTHIKNIYGKLDVHRRLDAIRRAKELGLI